MSKSSKVWIAIIFAAIGFACLLPQTGWMGRMLLGVSLRLPPYEPTIEPRASELYVDYDKSQYQDGFYSARDWAEDSTDLGVHIAFRHRYAKEVSKSLHTSDDSGVGLKLPENFPGETVRASWPLLDMFPSNPALYAYLLREMLLSCHIRRDGEYKSGIPRSGPTADQEQHVWRSAASPVLLELTRRAERLEPNNAFFTMVRCSELAAMYRDREAIDALHEAVQKTEWNEHISVQVFGDMRLQAEVLRDQSLEAQMRSGGSVSWSYPSNLRDLSRTVLIHAQRLEQTGRPQEGIAIRRDLVKLAGLLRTKATNTTITSLGISIAKQATAHPGTVSTYVLPKGTPHDKIEEIVQGKFVDYLKRLGAGNDAKTFTNEWQLGRNANAIYLGDHDHETRRYQMAQLLWQCNLVLLGSLLWIGIIGFLASFVARTGFVIRGERLPIEIPRGLLMAILTGIAISALNLPGDVQGITFICCWLGIGGTVLLLHLRGFGISSAMFGVAWTLASVAVWQVILWQSRSIAIFGLEPPQNCWGPARLDETAAIPCLILVGTFMIGLALLSWRLRVPMSVGVVRAMRGLALPVIAIGLVVWLPLLIATARFEDRASAELRAEVVHEGKAMAARVGRDWPGK